MPDRQGKRLVLIDGHGLAYRMFFALRELSTPQGEPSGATYGFTRTLLSLIGEADPPDYLAVSFDVGATFRDELFEEYKATREKMPEELGIQIRRIREVLEALNIPVLEAEGYEADDVLGTVARLAGEMGVDTLIVTGDKDLLQLVDEHTIVQLPGRRSGEVQRYDVAAVQEAYDIAVEQFVDFKALIGDKSDNIPGVPGIGEKTAVSLLQQYGTLDGIYEHLEEISSTRARNALASARDMAFLSRQLSQIVTDAPIAFDLEACHTQDYDRSKVIDLFRVLGFRSLLELLPGGGGQEPFAEGGQLSFFADLDTSAPAVAPVAVEIDSPTVTHIIQDDTALEALIRKLESAEAIAFDTETTSTDQMQADLVGIALSIGEGEGYYIPVGHQGQAPQLSLQRVIDALRPALTHPQIPKVGHNIKYDAILMARHGLEVNPLSFDTMIAAWLLYPDDRLGLKDLVFSKLGIAMTEITALIGQGKGQITMDRVPIELAAAYAAADADMTLQLMHLISAELEQQEKLKALFYEIEMPLVPVLIEMERAGVLVDVEVLHRMSAELGGTLAQLEKDIYATVGYQFNLNSPKQLSEALFEKLRLPTQGLRKTKSGYFSTAADVLDTLALQDSTGVVETILQYRELEKLRSTYLDALPQMVNPDTGRIHTSFNQTGTVTGRLSSSDPNLQNIPIRREQGRRVRDAFIAAPGHRLIGADYSQVELRVLAHVSGDEVLRQAFHEDQDIHAATAAAVHNIPPEQVTQTQRSFAKAVNFGLLYGMGAFRLARDSELTLPEAELFIETYFKRFPRVRGYLEGTKQQAIEQGHVETLLGRRRYFPALQNPGAGRQDQSRAEREAVNMPIQGTAADIIKIAMIRLHQALKDRGLGAEMILQVHDELVLEVPEDEADQTVVLVKEVMENAYPMDVPLRVDVSVGQDWGKLK